MGSRSDILRGPGLSSPAVAGVGLAMVGYKQSCVCGCTEREGSIQEIGV